MRPIISIRVNENDLKMLEKNNIRMNHETFHQAVNFLIQPKTLELQMEEKIPDFRLTGVIKDHRKFFNYVQGLEDHAKNVDIVKALYSEYPDDKTRTLLMRMANPLDADLYLDYVNKALQEHIQIRDLEKEIQGKKQEIEDLKKSMADEISKLQNSKTAITQELSRIEYHMKNREKELEKLEDGIPEKEKYRDELDRTLANLRGDPGFEKVNALLTSVQKFLGAIYTDKGDAENERYINRDKFAILEQLRSNIPDLFEYLKSEKWITQSRVDDESRKRLEELARLKHENESIAKSDIGKGISTAKDILDNIRSTILDYEFLDKRTKTWVDSNLNDAFNILDMAESRKNNLLRKNGSSHFRVSNFI